MAAPKKNETIDDPAQMARFAAIINAHPVVQALPPDEEELTLTDADVRALLDGKSIVVPVTRTGTDDVLRYAQL